MRIDALMLVSDAQAVAATGVSTNTIDLKTVRAVGTGEPIGFGIAIDVSAVHTTGDETYTFDVIEDDDEALGSPNVLATRSFTAAQVVAGALVAGTRFFIEVPIGTPTQRYLGLRYTLGGNADNAVTVTAWLTPQSLFSIEPVAYPKGYVS